jgi:ribosomal protein S18 acetylase RimI-like enzyme
MFANTLENKKTTVIARTSKSIKTAGFLEEDQASAVILMAFSTDPAARWMYPEPHDYLKHFPEFIKYFAGKSFEKETAYYTDGFSGAALWLPPDVHPDEEPLISLFEETLPNEKKADFFPVFEQMGKYHPDEPHWYLPMIGVEAVSQNRGFGSALMRHALAVCDRDNLPAYLESSNPRNISLYIRYGFEICGTIQVGSSPPIIPMIRKSQSNGFSSN